jgi:hypothetical protein
MAIRVAPLEVDVQVRPARLAEAGFYDRMKRGWGAFTDPPSMSVLRKGYVRLSQLVQMLQGRAPLKTAMCGSSNTVFLDGRQVPPAFVRELSAWELGAAEVYADGAGLPVFAMTPLTLRCGATLLWSTVTTTGPRTAIPQLTVRLCESEGRPRTVTIDGVVMDLQTAVRLPAAHVRGSYTVGHATRGIEVRTDSLGRYRLCDIPRDAQLSLVASYNRMEGNPKLFEAQSDGPAVLQVPVTLPSMITGDVIHARTGRGLRSAAIKLAGTDHTARTNASGDFALGPVPPGSYTIETECGGFSRATAQVTIESEQEARVHLVLQPLAPTNDRCRS